MIPFHRIAAAALILAMPALRAADGPQSPQDQLRAFTLADGLEMELVVSENPEDGIGKFVAVYFDQKGALWTMTALEYPVDGNENPAAADALYQSKAKDKILVYDRDPSSPTGFARKPRVFADGLAIPLGILPYKNGCYVQHGHDIVFLSDTDGDGRADKREVILTGFGVQDSHLFPHQFTRAPGGWIWMSQGAFNYSKVRRPGDPPEKAIQFDQTRMAKFRPDGSDFTITSQGPCNVWGLVINGEGEAFIQEANDYGYPVMPFHEHANYPGCSDRQMKSYAPEFPGTAPDFRMGGTGLSGLALTDKDGIYPEPWRDVMLVANPITSKVQAIKMRRDGPYWQLEKPKDFVTSSDTWFRPVALTLAPDGCVYIVDWYNKIISHNEVPRAHPDRDKTRGRIWRVKPKAKALLEVPDFTKLEPHDLLAKLGDRSLAQSRLAAEAWMDLPLLHGLTYGALHSICTDKTASPAKRIQALWLSDFPEGYESENYPDKELAPLLSHPNRNMRREVVRSVCDASADVTSLVQGGGRWERIKGLSEEAFRGFAIQAAIVPLVDDPDPEVRAELIRGTARILAACKANTPRTQANCLALLLRFAREPLAQPTAPSTRTGKPIKVREAYDRDFERYLVRMFLERHPQAVTELLDSEAGKALPSEARLLAALSLDAKVGAPRVAALLPLLNRVPGEEEILRLMLALDVPAAGDALKELLAKPSSREPVLKSLLELRSRVDAGKLAPLLADAAGALLNGDAAQAELGLRVAGAFRLSALEPRVAALVERGIEAGAPSSAAVRALAELGSANTALFAKLAEYAKDAAIRDEALAALASSKALDAPERALALLPHLTATQRRATLDRLTTTKEGAKSVVAAIENGRLAKSEVDAGTLDRLLAILGDKDAALNRIIESLGSVAGRVLNLDGSETASVDTALVLEGPLTVETWVKLAPGVSNGDGILAVAGKWDLNFHDGRFRLWAGPQLNDAATAKKKVIPEMWTHVAATRDAAGVWKLYIDGELDATGSKVAPLPIPQPKIGATNARGGTQAQFAHYRIWNRERSEGEIRANFDRALPDSTSGLVYNSSGARGWGTLYPGAKIAPTSDLPPVLSAEAAQKLDADFAKYRALAEKSGDVERGKAISVMCRACHLMGTEGGQIGPNLSGVGAMGTEAILRNILTPSAAMESAYRIYRVEQKDGAVLDAFFVNEDKDAVVIRLPGGAEQRIPKSNIRATKFLRRSLMPEGLLEALTPEQVSDLFAYLQTLK